MPNVVTEMPNISLFYIEFSIRVLTKNAASCKYYSGLMLLTLNKNCHKFYQHVMSARVKCITMYVLKLNTWLIQKTLKTCPGRVYNVEDGCCLGNIKITKEQTVFSVVSVSG